VDEESAELDGVEIISVILLQQFGIGMVTKENPGHGRHTRQRTCGWMWII
jgi:hypothetical protein